MADLLLNMSPKFWIVSTLIVLAIHLILFLPSGWLMQNRELMRWTVAMIIAVMLATYVAAILPNPDLDGLFLRNRLTLHFQAHLAIAAVLWVVGALVLTQRRAS